MADDKLVEAVARAMVPFPQDPDEMATEMLCKEIGNGLRILPSAEWSKPLWMHYRNDARKVLKAIEEYHG